MKAMILQIDNELAIYSKGLNIEISTSTKIIIPMELLDRRLKGVKHIYKRIKNAVGLWGEWFIVDSLPSASDYSIEDLRFYPKTESYCIEMPNRQEKYFIQK